MASWGRESDTVLSGTGTITDTQNVVSGTGTAFATEISVGELLAVGTQNFIVTGITDNVTLEVVPAASGTETGQAVSMSQSPKYLTVSEATTEAVYITVADAQDANKRADGVKTPGWTLYEEYGNGRKRVETLVAMKST